MWSATWPEEVQALASDFLPNNLLRVQIGAEGAIANRDIEQKVRVCSDDEGGSRDDMFWADVEEINPDESGRKVLIFCMAKKTVAWLMREMRNGGYNALPIHGDLSQDQRQWALGMFKSGGGNILVATNVAARGIHVDGVDTVINFDFPDDVETYIHRIGRTGRAGKKGTAISYFDPERDGSKVSDLVECMVRTGQKVPEELQSIADVSPSGRHRGMYNAYNEPLGTHSAKDFKSPEAAGGGDDAWGDDAGGGGWGDDKAWGQQSAPKQQVASPQHDNKVHTAYPQQSTASKSKADDGWGGDDWGADKKKPPPAPAQPEQSSSQQASQEHRADDGWGDSGWGDQPSASSARGGRGLRGGSSGARGRGAPSGRGRGRGGFASPAEPPQAKWGAEPPPKKVVSREPQQTTNEPEDSGWGDDGWGDSAPSGPKDSNRDALS